MRRRSVLPAPVLFALALANVACAQVSGSVSVDEVKAGGSITVTGAIPPGEELNIVIASRAGFCTDKAAGPMERVRLAEAGRKRGFRGDTTIPYLFYLVTSNPEAFGEVREKSFGGAFFFKGLYKTLMFQLKPWDDIPQGSRGLLGPLETREGWDLLRYAHEEPFAINTIVKERTCRGKVVIFSRCVVADHGGHPHYWNKGTRVSLDRRTGEFSADFTTFSHTKPDTTFDVSVNGEHVGDYTVTQRGFWLPRGWRYVNPLVILASALVAGTFYSVVGASGGLLMAAFQIIIVGTAGPLGVNSANVLKPSNLPLTFTAPISALYHYWFKERRLAFPAALALGSGVLIGAFVLGPPLSSKYLNMSQYKPWLGILVLIMVVRTIYEMTPRGMKKRQAVRGVMEKFREEQERARNEGRDRTMGRVETLKVGIAGYEFKFWGERFRINIILFVCLGALIGLLSSSFGVGGGFLLVPALTMVGGLPMYLAVPISLFCSILGSSAGTIRYMLMGYYPDLWLVLAIMLGGLGGGAIGSRIQGWFSERQLKTMLAVILLFLVFRFLQIEVWI